MIGRYSILDIAAVVRDLARHPNGAELVADLRACLALGPADFAALDRTPRARSAAALREPAVELLRVQLRAHDALATARAAAATGGIATWSSALPLLEVAPLCGWDALDSWLRTEVLDAAWHEAPGGDLAVLRWPQALDVVSDGLLASYAAVLGDLLDVRALADPWRSARAGVEPAAAGAPAARYVIDLVAAATPEAFDCAGDALVEQRAAGWSWAHAMHEACWALELTGRGRDAAIAQFEALHTLLAVTGPGPRPASVAALTAAVHATMAADLLPAAVVDTMCRPLLSRLAR